VRNRLSAILLLALFLFNIVGYRVVFYFLQQYADQQMAVSLDNDIYDESDLITVSIPISLPYYNDWADFERADGEVVYEGIVYKYVKRKVSHGQLVLLCLPDQKRTDIASAKDAFFKYSQDLMQHQNDHKSSNSKVVEYQPITDFQQHSIAYLITTPETCIQQKLQFPLTADLSSLPHLSPEHPPQA
jgi:hypothetical protein